MRFDSPEFKRWLGQKVVGLDGALEDLEIEFEPGMIGKIVEIKVKHDDMLQVTLDCTEDLDHNRTKMVPNYWGPDGQATLTSEQAGFWPKNNKIDVYFMISDNVESYLKPLSGKAYGVHGERYLKWRKGPQESYHQWMERLITEMYTDDDPV